jgi:hypothetical protein
MSKPEFVYVRQGGSGVEAAMDTSHFIPQTVYTI